MRWLNGANWESLSAGASYGTYNGTCHVTYPEAAERDGNGRPVGAFGRPTVVLESAWMQDSGMAFWRARFSGTTDTYADISIEVFDQRVGSEVQYAGRLHWPTFSSLGRGADASKTVYRDVRIEISDCETL